MRLLCGILLICLSSASFADSWASAVIRGAVSPNGNIVVRIIPGNSLGDVTGFAGEKKGEPARAVYYRLTEANNYTKYQAVKLLNPIAPVDFAVSDAGELVTLDNWHNMGIGQAIAVYDPSGGVRRSFALKDVYKPDEIKKFTRSVSSVWWRCNPPPVFDQDSSSLAFEDRIGNVISIDLKSGVVSKPAKHKGC